MSETNKEELTMSQWNSLGKTSAATNELEATLEILKKNNVTQYYVIQTKGGWIIQKMY